MAAAGWHGGAADERHQVLRHRGFALEFLTLAWNVVGCFVLLLAVRDTGSVALGTFGLVSLVAIGASTVVVRELSDGSPERRRRALRLIGWAFLVLAGYLTLQTAVALALGHRPVHGALGVGWTAATALVMLALATGKARTGRELDDPVLTTGGRITLVDAALAAVVVLGVTLDAAAGWWWADAVAGLVVAGHAAHVARRTLQR